MNPNQIIDKILPILAEKAYHTLELKSILESANLSQEDFFTAFNDLDDLLTKAFYRLCDEADGFSKTIDQFSCSLDKLFHLLDNIYHLHIQYQFYFFNLLEIMKNQELIKDRYLDMIALRKTQLIHLFKLLATEGYFAEEKFPGSFENLANQMFMLSDYWLIHNQIVFGPDDIRLPYYNKLIFSAVLPYLTDKGMVDYKKILGYEKLN